MRRNLPTLKLSRLLDKRHKHAVTVLSAGLSKILPEGLPESEGIPEKLVELGMAELEATGYGGAVAAAERISSYFSLEFLSYLLTLTNKLSYHVGNITIVEDTKRFDLIGLLLKLQVALLDTRLRLVPISISLTDACFNYRWRGTLFEFALGMSRGSIRAKYVAWHPSPLYAPKSSTDLFIIRLQHRNNSDERGQSDS